jgi:hypothetical protein
VEPTEDRAVAAGHSVDLAAWQGLFDETMGRVAGRFGRVEPRRTARAFLLGLLSDVDGKSCVTTTGGPPGHMLLIRRNPSTGELAFYRCWSPRPVPLATLVRVAGMRWTVEETFQAGKGQVGLDQHQLRQWIGWHRFTVLAMLALAFLAACAAISAKPPATEPNHHGGYHDRPIRLTVNEIRRLFTVLANTAIHTVAHHLRWSLWRRAHQARARRAHYKRRLTAELGT